MHQFSKACSNIENRSAFLKALGYDGLAYIIDEAINDGSILSQSLKGGDEKLGNSQLFYTHSSSIFFFVTAQWQNPF